MSTHSHTRRQPQAHRIEQQPERAWLQTVVWSCLGCASIAYIVCMATYYEAHAHSHHKLSVRSDKHSAWHGSHHFSATWRTRNQTAAHQAQQQQQLSEAALRYLTDPSNLSSWMLPPSGTISDAVLTRLTLAAYNVSMAYKTNHSNILPQQRATQLLSEHAAGRPVISTRIPAANPLLASRNTLYLITPTYPGRGPRRNFLRRHVASLKLAVEESSSFWKPQPLSQNGLQLLWIVIDDATEIDLEIATLLRCAGLPYLYFAYGPTHSWGNAQRNVALMIVRALGRVGMSGPGYFMDDDSYVSPWLFEPLFQVERAMLWPISDIGVDGWEGPVLDKKTHEIKEWHAGWLERKFPVDMNAFAFHTAALQDEAFFKMPLLFDFTARGGETEFLQKLLEHKEDFEVLCEHCRFVWYNRPLGERDMLWPVAECDGQTDEQVAQGHPGQWRVRQTDG